MVDSSIYKGKIAGQEAALDLFWSGHSWWRQLTERSWARICQHRGELGCRDEMWAALQAGPSGGVASRCSAGVEHFSEMLTEKGAFVLVSSICVISNVVNRTRSGENHGNLTPTMSEIGLRRKLVGLTGK